MSVRIVFSDKVVSTTSTNNVSSLKVMNYSFELQQWTMTIDLKQNKPVMISADCQLFGATISLTIEMTNTGFHLNAEYTNTLDFNSVLQQFLSERTPPTAIKDIKLNALKLSLSVENEMNQQHRMQLFCDISPPLHILI